VVPRPAVERLRGYRGVSPEARFLDKTDGRLKLDWNESGVPPSPLVFDRLSAFLATKRLNWYADPSTSRLRRRLAAYAGRPVSQVQVFNGSDAALDCVARTFVGAGDHVVISAPCYDNFRVFATGLDANVEQVLGPSPFAVNSRGLISRIRPDTRLVYLCNPNNPTGCLYSPGRVEAILRAITGGILLVDEAYFEFAGSTVAGLLDRHDHLVIARSFSKAFGLAGLRCGYILGSERIIRYASRIRNGKDVSGLAQVAALAALDDIPYMKAYVDEVRRSRTWLVRALRGRGIDVVPSPANFVMLGVDAPGAFVEALRTQGIYVRDRSYLPQLGRYVRATVGTREQSSRLVAAIDALIAEGRFRPGTPRG
jgi:histidinol-phosphate aminotransferase